MTMIATLITFFLLSLTGCLGELRKPSFGVRVNQKTLDDLANHFEQIIPKLFSTMPVPKTIYQSGTFADTNVTNIAVDMGNSTVSMLFSPNDTIVISTRLPIIKFGAHAFIDAFFDIDTNVTGEVVNSAAQISVKLENVGVQKPEISQCNVGLGSIRLAFPGSTALTLVSPIIEVMFSDMLRGMVNKTICEQLPKAILDVQLCEDSEKLRQCQSKMESFRDFTFNSSARDSIEINNRSAVLLSDGTVGYRGKIPSIIEGNKWMYSGDNDEHPNSANLFISDRIVNNLLAVMFDNKMMSLNQQVASVRVPRFLRGICGSCGVNFKVQGKLYQAPTVEISRDSITLTLYGWLLGRKTIFGISTNVFKVATNMKVLIFPEISGENLAITGRVARFSIEFLDTGFIGAIVPGLVDAVEELVEDVVRPMINRKLSQSIPLNCVFESTSACGVIINNGAIRLVDNAMIIDANLSFDLKDRLVRAMNKLDTSTFDNFLK